MTLRKLKAGDAEDLEVTEEGGRMAERDQVVTSCNKL